MIERYDPRAEAQQMARYYARYADQFHGSAPAALDEALAGGSSLEAELTDGGELMEPAEVEMAAEASGEADQSRRSRKAHWAAWTAAMVTMGVVLGLVIVGILKFVNDPAEAVTKSLAKEQASTSPTPYKPPTNLLGGVNVNLSYPGVFDQINQAKNSAHALEQYMLSSKGNYRHTIGVEVNPLPAGGLSEDADYRVRLLHAQDYHEAQEHMGDDLVSVMTKVDKSEQTMFWVHGDKVLSVAITSTDPHDDIPAFLATIKASVRWRS